MNRNLIELVKPCILGAENFPTEDATSHISANSVTLLATSSQRIFPLCTIHVCGSCYDAAQNTGSWYVIFGYRRG